MYRIVSYLYGLLTVLCFNTRGYVIMSTVSLRQSAAVIVLCSFLPGRSSSLSATLYQFVLDPHVLLACKLNDDDNDDDFFRMVGACFSTFMTLASDNTRHSNFVTRARFVKF